MINAPLQSCRGQKNLTGTQKTLYGPWDISGTNVDFCFHFFKIYNEKEWQSQHYS